MSERGSRCASLRAGREAVRRFRRLALKIFSRCQHCGRQLSAKTATVDHLKPAALGGTDEVRNLSIACSACNNRKDSRWKPGAAVKFGPSPWTEEMLS